MLACLISIAAATLVQPHEELAFVSFMREHNLFYVADEYQLRLGIFLSNARFVQEFNAGNNGFKVGINHLSALTATEYKSMLGGKQSGFVEETRATTARIVRDVPEELDYREKDCVNPVKDQGQCGSCWAFSAITAQESQWKLVKGELQVLSEANLVDCVDTCSGCDGGWTHYAYKFVMNSQWGKFMLDEDYPYKPSSGRCRFNKTLGVQSITGYVTVGAKDEGDLLEKVATYGPASVCIDASMSSFMMYKSGIYYDNGCSWYSTNHAVGCVGYGVDGDDLYWIVRNSWSHLWGEDGYIRMARDQDNNCCIACKAFIPTVE